MSMNITIAINADNDGKFTAHEQSVLQALAGRFEVAEQSKEPTPVGFQAKAPAAAGEPVKAEPKPRVTRKPKPEPTAAAVLEDPEEVEEKVAETEPVEDQEDEQEEAPAPKRKPTAKKADPGEKELTTRDAISAATPLISEGAAGRAKVKEALAAVEGAKKVSDLKTHAEVAAFLEALEA